MKGGNPGRPSSEFIKELRFNEAALHEGRKYLSRYGITSGVLTASMRPPFMKGGNDRKTGRPSMFMRLQ